MLRRTAQDPRVPLGGFVGRIPTPLRPPRRRRAARVARPLLLVVVALGLLGPAGSGPAGAQGGGDDDGGTTTTTISAERRRAAGEVLVVNASGLLDPVLVDFLEQSLADAEAAEARAFVIQLNSE